MKDPEAKKRLRFIKELERFLSRASNYLTKENCDWDGLRSLAQNAPQLGAVKLYNSRYSEQIRIAGELIARCNAEPIDLSEIADWLRGELNRAEKTARARTYSRQKSYAKQDET